MFKWGLFKKELSDTDLPAELKAQMQSLYSGKGGTDRVVMVMDQLCQLIREQQMGLEKNKSKIMELETKLDQARLAKNFQADLLVSMCDEIQAPIHTLNQLGDWLDQTHLDPNQRSCFNFYRRTGRKLNDLFNNIINVAKMREGILQPDPISFQLNETVREIMQILNLTAQEKGIPLSIHIDPDVPQYLIGDVKRLEQILVSLINNAIKFTYEGEVQVRVQKGSDDGAECTLDFQVMDSGVGLPENQIDNLFDRLAQGDPDVERNYGGTGLGLYICKCFVEQMGGSIWAENRKAGGATFGFSICFEKGSMEETEEEMLTLSQNMETPESENNDATAEDKTPQNNDSETPPEKNGTMKILVVDDCLDTCRLIEEFLEKGPYEVHVVNDGVAALQSYEEDDYDLILMDIQLPHLDGVGATMEIRNKEAGREVSKIPIFALVGNPGEAQESYYLAADFDRCLIKPVSREDLLEAIDTLKISR